jgi:hypothetical protein
MTIIPVQYTAGVKDTGRHSDSCHCERLGVCRLGLPVLYVYVIFGDESIATLPLLLYPHQQRPHLTQRSAASMSHRIIGSFQTRRKTSSCTYGSFLLYKLVFIV